MEKTLKFNSQIATSRVQSERLLALGLKKETADMWRGFLVGGETLVPAEEVDLYNFYVEPIPAWSLHRLIEMFLNSSYYLIESIEFETDDEEDAYTKTIRQIEWLIKEGYFPKEYLV